MVLSFVGPNFGHPNASEVKNIYELQDISPPTYPTAEIRLTQGLGTMLTVRVRQFDDHPAFKTVRVYHTKSGRRELKMARLCLADMDWTRNSVREYIRSTWCDCLGSIMLESTSVVQEILRLALQHSRANPVSLFLLNHSCLRGMLIGLIEHDRSPRSHATCSQSNDRTKLVNLHRRWPQDRTAGC
jgi:hypothetical protein